MRKKIIIILLILASFLLLGCDNNMTAKEAVRDYLEMYITLDGTVVEQLDEYVEKEDFTNEQKVIYKEILRKQYSSMTYTFLNETYEEDVAYIKTKINVIDLAKVQEEAQVYFNGHKDEFNDNEGNYDKVKLLNYKLELMKEAKDTTSYEIEFKVLKDGKSWEVSQLSNDDLEKIHGVYIEE